ncbi:MAG: hypothetical protein M1828_002277 [Chrysothrix sp. TS-e1954]|nr:MAG: hypothetical protein M1828_002277 [Chrysothrix sp. TS-e1954]
MASCVNVPLRQNQDALDYFVRMPVDRDMINYLAVKASEVIRCEPTPQQNKNLPPTPPATPPGKTSTSGTAPDTSLPSVEAFIMSLCSQSHVQVPTLMTSLVYLGRLQKKLPPVAKGMRCTVHRIFLAALILAAKNLNDSSPKNKHWARYTAVPGYEHFCFSTTEVNLMEKQLLFLLDWDLNVSEDDLLYHFEPFLAPIRIFRAQEAEKKLHQRRLREQEKALNYVAATRQTCRSRSRLTDRATMTYDSPASICSSRLGDVYSRQMQPYSSRSSSLMRSLPLRTPSLSPTTRTDSSAASVCSYADSVSSGSPVSLVSAHVDPCEQVHIQQAYEAEAMGVPAVIHIQPTPSTNKQLTTSLPTHPLALESDYKPVKKARTGPGSFLARLLYQKFQPLPSIPAPRSVESTTQTSVPVVG